MPIGKENASLYNEDTNKERLEKEDAKITRRNNYVLFQW